MKKSIGIFWICLAAIGLGLPASAAAHSVKFLDWDGTALTAEQSIEEGKCAYPPANPIRFGYVFRGWTHDGGTTLRSYVEIDKTTPISNSVAWTAHYTESPVRKLRVGVFSGPGCNGGRALKYHRHFRLEPHTEYVALSPELWTEGSIFDRIDLVAVPGGTTPKLYYSITNDNGVAKFKSFLREKGGRYFGTCAGTSVMLNDNYEYRFKMVPYLSNSGQDYHQPVPVALTSAGQELFDSLGWDGTITNDVHYSYGPVLKPTAAISGAGFTVLARYGETDRSALNGHGAIVCGTNRLGRIWLTAVHPEEKEANFRFIEKAVAWLFREGTHSTELASVAASCRIQPFDSQGHRVAWGPSSFTDEGATRHLPIFHAVDDHPDYQMTPLSKDEVDAASLVDGETRKFDALVVESNWESYLTNAKVERFRELGGVVVFEGDGLAAVMEGLRGLGVPAEDPEPTPEPDPEPTPDRERVELPEGYTQLRYIESDGTQYIKTGIDQAYPVKAEFRFETLKMKSIQSGNESSTLYLLAATSSGRSFLIRYAASGWGWGFGDGANASASTGYYGLYPAEDLPAPVASNFYNVVSVIKGGRQTLTVNGVTAETQTCTGTIVAGRNRYILFGQNSGSTTAYTPNYVSPARLYICRIYTGSDVSTLEAEFIPCRRESDGAVGVYNTVSQGILASATSSLFAAGPVLGRSRGVAIMIR